MFRARWIEEGEQTLKTFCHFGIEEPKQQNKEFGGITSTNHSLYIFLRKTPHLTETLNYFMFA